jgi:hypothetical protein
MVELPPFCFSFLCLSFFSLFQQMFRGGGGRSFTDLLFAAEGVG